MAERVRADGAGIPAFYTKTGYGTVVAEGKAVEEFDGEMYIRETWLRADLAIIKAWRADTAGNLMFRKTARNFNPNMATAVRTTVVEVDETVEASNSIPTASTCREFTWIGLYAPRLTRNGSRSAPWAPNTRYAVGRSAQ